MKGELSVRAKTYIRMGRDVYTYKPKRIYAWTNAYIGMDV